MELEASASFLPILAQVDVVLIYALIVGRGLIAAIPFEIPRRRFSEIAKQGDYRGSWKGRSRNLIILAYLRKHT